jgi:predicted membrane channel-forming protein YqfA (hemolysin III family)
MITAVFTTLKWIGAAVLAFLAIGILLYCTGGILYGIACLVEWITQLLRDDD